MTPMFSAPKNRMIVTSAIFIEVTLRTQYMDLLFTY